MEGGREGGGEGEEGGGGDERRGGGGGGGGSWSHWWDGRATSWSLIRGGEGSVAAKWWQSTANTSSSFALFTPIQMIMVMSWVFVCVPGDHDDYHGKMV